MTQMRSPVLRDDSRRCAGIPSVLPDGCVRIAYVVPPTRLIAGVERDVREICSRRATDDRQSVDVHAIRSSRGRQIVSRPMSDAPHRSRADRLRRSVRPLRRFLNRHAFVMVMARREIAALPCVAAVTSRLNGRVLLIPRLHGGPGVEGHRSAINPLLSALRRPAVAARLAATLAVSRALADRIRSGGLAGGRSIHHVPSPSRRCAPASVARARMRVLAEPLTAEFGPTAASPLAVRVRREA